MKTPKDYFAELLHAARKQDASDLHLVADMPPAYRVNGEIVIPPDREPLSGELLNNLTKVLLSAEQQARLEKERELCVSIFDADCGRVRLSLYHHIGIVEMAIRMCNLQVKSAEELMLPPIIDQLAEKTSGLIIVSGPTGMGKTTTLNYIIDVINSSRRGRIITIEDPVEFEHPHKKCIVTQIEVGTDTNDFAHCLRSVLRLNPDVIVIGEMRDLDTMETALTAAETGHLVLATLHTPSASGAVERIVSSFEGRRQPQIVMQLATTLQGAIAQRLLPTADKERRVLATEVLIANDAVRNMIREGKAHMLYNPICTSRAAGMHSLEDSLSDLYRRGLITIDHALANANNPGMLQRLLKA